MSALIPGPEIVPETTDAGEGTEDAFATHVGVEPVALPPQPIAAAPISDMRDGTLAREKGMLGSVRRFHGVRREAEAPSCAPSLNGRSLARAGTDSASRLSVTRRDCSQPLVRMHDDHRSDRGCSGGRRIDWGYRADIAHATLPYRGPVAYSDKRLQRVFYVESDGLHLSCIGFDGKVMWTRVPFVDAKLEPYRMEKPRIVFIGQPLPWMVRGKKGMGTFSSICEAV
jgi:hypothetical protein